jgi:hypothetical protein
MGRYLDVSIGMEIFRLEKLVRSRYPDGEGDVRNEGCGGMEPPRNFYDLFPSAFMIWCPIVRMPISRDRPPQMRIQIGVPTLLDVALPVSYTAQTAEKGPTALATSFAPCEREKKQQVESCKN